MRDPSFALISVLMIASVAWAESPREVVPLPEVVSLPVTKLVQDVNGLTITIPIHTNVQFLPSTNSNKVTVNIVGDLSDLQTNLSGIIDRFPLPKDNCGKFSTNNFVVSLPSKRLLFRDDGRASLVLGGSVTAWACIENPVPNSKVEWESRTLGLGIKTKVPVVKTWPGDPIKTVVGTQPFEATLPVSLVK
jgi:hypothetical protein